MTKRLAQRESPHRVDVIFFAKRSPFRRSSALQPAPRSGITGGATVANPAVYPPTVRSVSEANRRVRRIAPAFTSTREHGRMERGAWASVFWLLFARLKKVTGRARRWIATWQRSIVIPSDPSLRSGRTVGWGAIRFIPPPRQMPRSGRTVGHSPIHSSAPSA